MSLVSISNLSFSYGSDKILDGITFSIEKESKLGLIGTNGSGKTTIFKLINGDITPESGGLHLASKCKTAYLSQKIDLDENRSLYDEMLSSRNDILELRSLIEKTEMTIAQGGGDNKIYSKLDKLQNQYTVLDGYNFENQLRKILSNLNFNEDELSKKINNFSGGERSRIQLAKILLKDFDLLLLDEPTNHLDIFMLEWLENYLINLNKPYIIVSHNRNFLDKTVNKIIELKNKHIYTYTGNYSQYEAQALLIERQINKQYREQEAFIKKTEFFIRKNMAGQKVSQAKSRLKMLNKLEKIEIDNNKQNYSINIEVDKRSGNIVYQFENLDFGFNSKKLCQNLNLVIEYGDKIALIGKNGCGKTTFFKVLLGENHNYTGLVKQGANLQIGYYDQDHFQLDESLSIMETIWELMPSENQQKVFSYLAKFGFIGPETEKLVSCLSGGEKARLFLAKLIFEKPNFLILDEPTNHLDINTIKFLEESLSRYEGTILFVSHDKYFIKNVANKIWLYKNKTIKRTYKDFEEILIDYQVGSSDKSRPKKNTEVKPKEQKSKRTNPIILNKLLQDIEKFSVEIKEKKNKLFCLQQQYSQKEIYTNPELVGELNQKINIEKKVLEDLTAKLDELELNYLELSG